MTVTTGGPRKRTLKEERAAAIDEVDAADEFDKAKRTTPKPEPKVQRIATDYVHATRSDGVAVVFIPGEAVPDWVPDGDGITPTP